MSTTHLPSPPARRPRRPEGELRALVDEFNAGWQDRGVEPTAEEVAAWVAATFPETAAVACSMADAVLPHLVSRVLPGVDVLFLDTGYHFSDTLVTRDVVAEDLPITLVNVVPDQTVAEQDATHGPRLYERDPALCCRLRKVEPLARTLPGYEAWVTGVRRDEASTRTFTPLVSWDEKNGLVKVNPLAAWSFEQLQAYAAEHGVEVNPLLSDGYPSIGCEPCTRRVEPGEDPRAGRWTGFAKTECGLHT
ncbi:phosphoadenosine phosphosulfate reductase [Intrasporangium chromatireducens Q5-1]|uniref:Adenosine 5'-phosphosulfate reductase n=1 Tax=Intrasporangium chromatireducens Q5-1 TaxID=584657 RepID=W9GCM8_9MICO|nr:phosphoadenylyl-sulfate reductase [Intrasporangium chromatireducens]EWT03971.1 phosphoadenosine phosphosulfate reductase [Intrasporangium chromatireducens Q5-1]